MDFTIPFNIHRMASMTAGPSSIEGLGIFAVDVVVDGDLLTAWPCRCGAGRCRGQVAGDFFHLPPERQREYRPLLAEWYVRRNRDRLE